MLEMPEAEPTCSVGTALVAADEHGPFDIDIPTAAATNGMTNKPYDHDSLTRARAPKPTAVIRKPRPTIRRGPHLLAHFGTNGAEMTRPIVAGMVAKPASRGL